MLIPKCSRGSSLAELMVAAPIFFLLLGGCIRISLGAWSDVWRAHRYSVQNSEEFIPLELAVLPRWNSPVDRKSGRLILGERTWTVRGKEIWRGLEVHHDEN